MRDPDIACFKTDMFRKTSLRRQKASALPFTGLPDIFQRLSPGGTHRSAQKQIGSTVSYVYACDGKGDCDGDAFNSVS